MKTFAKLPCSLTLFLWTVLSFSFLCSSCHKEQDIDSLTSESVDKKIVDRTNSQARNSHPEYQVILTVYQNFLKTREAQVCENFFKQVSYSPSENVLVFKSNEHFTDVFNCLEMNVDEWNNIFESKYGNLDDDQVELKEDEIQFDEDQPLLDFEERFHFTSLRYDLNLQIDNWLASPPLDFANDPNDHFVTDEDMRAMISPNCEVKIGSEIIDVCYADDESRLGICIFSDCCHTGHESRNEFYDNDNRRIKVTVTLRAYFFGSTLRGKIRNYRKRSNGNWRKTRTKLSILCDGFPLAGSECNATSQRIGDSKGPKRRRRLETAYTHGGAFIPMKGVDETFRAAGLATSSQVNLQVPLLW